MKKLICMSLALLLLSGCAALEEDILLLPTPTASPVASPTAAATPSPSPTVAALPTPSPSPQPSPTPQLPFPDIVFSDEESANSGAMLYEDDENIYYCDCFSLFQIQKSNGKVMEIGEFCNNYSFLDKTIYYIDGIANSIIRYDPSTGNSNTVLKFEDGLFEIAAYEHKLYFTCITAYFPDGDPGITSDLFVANPDGSNMKMICQDAESFCIDAATIYYTSSSCSDAPPLYSCTLNGSNRQQIFDESDWLFDVREGIYCCALDAIVCNLASSEKIKLPGCDDCVLAGQYAFYVTSDAFPALCALDLNTRITYTLVPLPEGYYGLEATGQAVYLCDYNTGLISRINVQSGAAKLDTVVQL